MKFFNLGLLFLLSGLLTFAPLLQAQTSQETKNAREIAEQVETTTKTKWIKTELYFGLTENGKDLVSKSEWNNFLADSITKHFPEGLTVLDAYGQSQLETGEEIKQSTKIVVLMYEDSPK